MVGDVDWPGAKSAGNGGSFLKGVAMLSSRCLESGRIRNKHGNPAERRGRIKLLPATNSLGHSFGMNEKTAAEPDDGIWFLGATCRGSGSVEHVG